MQPISLKLPDGTEKNYNVPTAYHELTQDQYLGALAILNNTDQKLEMQWYLVPLLMKIPFSELQLLNEVQRVELLMELSFLTDYEAMPSKAMITSFATLGYKNKYIPKKVARALSARLYGPGDVLGYLNFGEFMAAETRLETYQRSKENGQLGNQKALNEFCGILFRKAAKHRLKEDDKREPFREGTITANGRVFEAVSNDVKAAIIHNYQGAKQLFPKLYPNLFPKRDENDKAAAEQQRRSQAMGWLNTLSAMAERDVIKQSKIKLESIHSVLYSLNESILHNIKMKEEMERHRAKR